jgi:hypothetical protein
MLWPSRTLCSTGEGHDEAGDHDSDGRERVVQHVQGGSVLRFSECARSNHASAACQPGPRAQTSATILASASASARRTAMRNLRSSGGAFLPLPFASQRCNVPGQIPAASAATRWVLPFARYAQTIRWTAAVGSGGRPPLFGPSPVLSGGGVFWLLCPWYRTGGARGNCNGRAWDRYPPGAFSGT